MTVENRTILIVEDDNIIRENLTNYFSSKNIVLPCKNLSQAKEAIENNQIDIVLLDIILPDGSGMKLLEHLENIPVIVLSDLNSDEIVLESFSAGAIDYIVKPASCEIIEARMELRLLPKALGKLSSHGLDLDMSKRTVLFKNTPLELTSSEFNILMFLMRNAGTFFTASEIYEHVWKMPYLNTTTIKTHLSNLRKKMLNISKECADLILTEFGKGYAFIGGSIYE